MRILSDLGYKLTVAHIFSSLKITILGYIVYIRHSLTLSLVFNFCNLAGIQQFDLCLVGINWTVWVEFQLSISRTQIDLESLTFWFWKFIIRFYCNAKLIKIGVGNKYFYSKLHQFDSECPFYCKSENEGLTKCAATSSIYQSMELIQFPFKRDTIHRRSRTKFSQK